jgi:hypothetical protein
MDKDIEVGPKCENKDCGQDFNNENTHLAVCLYGVFFLVGHEKGFIGFTCPRCLKTSLFGTSSHLILDAKKELTSRVKVLKERIDENGRRIGEQATSFEPDLRYHSQFILDDEIRRKLNISHFGFNADGKNCYLPDQINNFMTEELSDSKNYLCSYVEDSSHPAEGFTAIYWYREEDIESLLAFENENNIRIFPRYHYYTGLVESIDSLLGSHYFMGKDFEKAKEDHEKENRATVETLKAYAREKNINFDNLVEGIELDDPQVLQSLIEENQKQKANDPKISGMFLDILISDPLPLGDISKGHCEYLWAEVNPFHHKDIPEYFPDEVEDEKLRNKAQGMREYHSKMVGLIQENFHKQYVQEFLKSDLIPFLEEYELLARSKGISYAEIWKLKEGYLEALYKETNEGLRNEKPFVMYQEGKGWKIVFNGKPYSGLIGIGFLWIYQTLLNPEKKIYYTDLNDRFGIKKEGFISSDEIETLDEAGNKISTEAITNEMELTDQLATTYSGTLIKEKSADADSLKTWGKAYEILLKGKDEALVKKDFKEVDEKKKEIEKFQELLKKEYGFSIKKEKGKLKFIEEKKKDDRYQQISNNVKKNYRDAKEIIKKLDKDLYSYFSDHIRSEGGAFIYTPSKDIDWHLS